MTTNPEEGHLDVEAEKARLEQVEAEIQHARQALQQPHHPEFSDSGSIHPEQDDQAIAPPG